MTIVEAVTNAINGGQDHRWAEFMQQELVGHRLHVRYAQNVDGWDIRAFHMLAKTGTCRRAGLTHETRKDGTEQPMLTFQYHFEGSDRRDPDRKTLYTGIERRLEQVMLNFNKEMNQNASR